MVMCQIRVTEKWLLCPIPVPEKWLPSSIHIIETDVERFFKDKSEQDYSNHFTLTRIVHSKQFSGRRIGHGNHFSVQCRFMRVMKKKLKFEDEDEVCQDWDHVHHDPKHF